MAFFLLGTSFFVLENQIFTFLEYANEESVHVMD